MFTQQQARAVFDGWKTREAQAANTMPDWMMPCDQAQEHADYVAGSASDHQNAYAMSQMGHSSGMRGVLDLVSAGLHVVVVTGPAYCRSTDALIGERHQVVACYFKREDADAEAARVSGELFGDGDYSGDCGLDVTVYPKPLRPTSVPGLWTDDTDEIPF